MSSVAVILLTTATLHIYEYCVHRKIHPSIHHRLKPLILFMVTALEPIPIAIGRAAGYTLDKCPAHHRADIQGQQPHRKI